MANLQVKNLPDELHALLAERARREGVSMSDYVTRVLRRDLTRPTIDEWLAAHAATGPARPIDVAAALDDVRLEYAPDQAPSRPTGRPSDPTGSAAERTSAARDTGRAGSRA